METAPHEHLLLLTLLLPRHQEQRRVLLLLLAPTSFYTPSFSTFSFSLSYHWLIPSPLKSKIS